MQNRMSQRSEVERLKALLEKSEREKLELMAKLSRVESYNLSTAPMFDASQANHEMTSRPPLNNNGPSSSTAMPRGATGSLRSQLEHARQDQSRPMKRSKTTHAPGSSAMAPMMRSRSNLPRPRPNPNPFVAKGSTPITPPLSATYIDQGQFQHPASILIPDDLPADGQPQHGNLGREMGVEEFLSMSHEDLFPTTSPINIQAAVLSEKSEQDPSSSIPSVCGSMTSGPTLDTAPMSRRNSALNDNVSFSGQFSEMVRIQSQHSTRGRVRQDSLRLSPIATHPRLLGKRSSEDSSVVDIREDSFPYAHPSSAPTRSMLSQHYHPMETSLSQSSILSTSSADRSHHEPSGLFLGQHLSMERSVSKDSVKSNSSLKIRAKEALSRQNLAAKSRHLQPKPAARTTTQVTADSGDGSAKDGKAVITKTKYERPKHPKVMCNQCNEHPEGFRGEHELRRHTEAKHKSMIKKWICRDPALLGIPHSETAVKPLRDCKHCSRNKQYGAYYNAAAHLRRTHFKVKPRKGASGSSNGPHKADEEKEKRGGKGGGDWPPMSELKHWMIEVTVPMDQPGALVPDGTESVGAVEPEDLENEFGDSQYGSQPAGIPMPMGSDGFDMAVFAGVGEGIGQTIGLTGASFQGELDSQLSEIYHLNGLLFPTSPMQAAPISSAGFDYRNSDLHLQQGMPSSLMSTNSHGYTSPVSSTATITQAGPFGDHLLPHPAVQASRDDLADLPFDLTFTAVGQ